MILLCKQKGIGTHALFYVNRNELDRMYYIMSTVRFAMSYRAALGSLPGKRSRHQKSGQDPLRISAFPDDRLSDNTYTHACEDLPETCSF